MLISSFKKVKARRLSKQGSHAAALSLCDFSDPKVLFNAGMHDAVLKCADELSIYRAHSLLAIGRQDESFKLYKEIKGTKPANLIGGLALHFPAYFLLESEKRPSLISIRYYCLECLGCLESGIPFLKGLEVLGLKYAVRRNDEDLANKYLKNLYEGRSLTAPKIKLPIVNNFLKSILIDSHRKQLSSEVGIVVSVVMTVFNEEDYICDAVDSILKQSLQEIELIIVDDASNDSTCDVIADLVEKNINVKAVYLSTNVGTWEAKNIGLKQAVGEFVTMHDADDWSHPDKLFMQAQELRENPRLMSVSSYFFRVSEEDGLPFTRNAHNFIRWNPSSLMYRSSVIEHIGGYYSDLLGGDCEFSARIETKWGVDSHKKIKLPLSIGLQRKGSLSNRYRVAVNEGSSVTKRIHDWEFWRKEHSFKLREGALHLLSPESSSL